MDKIKIAIIRPYGYPIDPASYNCQEIGLARGLSLQGIDVDILMAGTEAKMKRQRIQKRDGTGEIHVYQLPYYKIPLIDHAVYPHLKNILMTNRYNLLHVNEENEITSFLVARLGRKIGVPVVIYQGMYQQLTGRIRAAFQTTYDRVALPRLRQNIHLALAKTTEAERHLQRKGFDKTLVIPVGLDTSVFVDTSELDWRARLNIDDEAKVILYVGAFKKGRNIDLLLDLAKKLANRSDLVFVYAGVGTEHDWAKSRMEKEKIGNVRLPGLVPQQDLPSLYRESSLFLLPSDSEIYGMVVLEAMYFGVPVISTKTAGPSDIIESGKNGYIIENLSVERWGETVTAILDSPAHLSELKNNAKEKVHSSLTWEKVAKKYVSDVVERVGLI